MMEGWKQITLGDVLHIKHGYGFKGEFFVEEPTKNILVTPGNFLIGGGFKNDKLKYYDGPIDDSFILSDGDVIVTMTDLSKQADTLGYSAKVPKSKGFTYLHNQRIGLISLLSDEYDLNFIYWLLRTHSYQRFIAGSSSGATVKHTSPKKIYSTKLTIPSSLKTQRKIASILSAYDDLIENNLKRIQLLEEQAQLTYEEWFVRFKFPGHEEVEFVDGLPEGWERVKLSDCCELIMGQSPKSEFYNDEKIGLPFHQGVKDYGFRFPTNSSWSTQGNRIAKEDSVLFSVRAPVGRLNVAIEEIIIGRGLAAINHNNGWNGLLLYQLQNIFYEDNLMGGGAIYNSVTKKDVERIEIIHATSEINMRFNDLAANIDKNIKNLTKQNQLLKEARDILLPRLMSGMIDVETLLGETAQKSTAPNQSKVRKLNPDTTIEKRKAIAAYIILESEVEEQFGKVKFEKLLHLSEFHAVCGNYERNYKKFAAGPLDSKFTYAFLDEAEKNNLIRFQKMGKLERIRVGDKEKLQEIVAAQLDKETQEEIKETVRLFLGSNYEKPEMVSTLYAVWNNRIIKNEMINDELIKKDFFEWDDNKKKYKGKLDRELTWMRKHGVVPEGWGEVI